MHCLQDYGTDHCWLCRVPQFAVLVQDRVSRSQLCPGIGPSNTFNDCVSQMREGKCGHDGCGPVNAMTLTLCGAEAECQDSSSDAALKKVGSRDVRHVLLLLRNDK